MSRGARDPRQPVTVKWDPTTLLLSFIGSDDDLPIAGFASDSAPSIPKSLVDAKGDLIAASADNTPVRVAVGSDGDSLVADSTQTSGLAYSQTAQPNLVLNSDFGRRTVFGLAMPEVFADLSGTTKIDGGAAGSVAANVFTQGAANNEYGWCATSFVWRDGRASATFKAVATAGVYDLRWRIDGSNFVMARQNNGNFTLVKDIATVVTGVGSVAQALTLNRWYWLEIEKQGTTFIAKIYDTGGTVPGVTKASSTLLQTLSATVSDAAVQVGAHISIFSDQATGQWGGIATGNGGVYVETWLPESWGFASSVHGGTLGGQAIGFDESADSGPLAKQWAMRAYIPAQDRTITLVQDTPDGSQGPSLAWSDSFYFKTSGKAGANNMVRFTVSEANSALTLGVTHALADAGETSWTRSTTTYTGASTQRRSRLNIFINPTGGGGATTGTAYVMLPQLERGGVATAWRNAPEDGGGEVWYKASVPVTAPTNATTTFAEIDSRDLAGNFFFPRDSNVEITFHCAVHNGTINDDVALGLTIDGVSQGFGVTDLQRCRMGVAAIPTPASFTFRAQLAAGKHRIAVQFRSVIGGTSTISNLVDTTMVITAFVGK